MAVKHPVVECVEPNAEARLTVILRTLRSITTQHNLKEIELQRLCESIVYNLGTVAMPTKTEDYVKFMSDIQSVQDILKTYANKDAIFATLKALYNAISDPQKPRHPTMSIVLQLINVEAIPVTVKYILQYGINENSLEEALMTLCNWLSRWTLTKNLGPLVLNFMSGLEDEQHFDILIEVTLCYIERLFKLLILPEPRETVGPVVLHMLQSMQHSPEAFHKILPHVNNVFIYLERENSESSLLYLNGLVNLCAALMDHFPGYPTLYESLTRSLEPFEVTSNFKDTLNCKSWIDTSSTTITTRFSSGKVGLNNLGNTCYMNSVLQALFMTKLFRNDILLNNQGALPLFAKLQALFALLQHSQRTSMSPNDILNFAKPPGFQIGHQHDSSEFLGYLLDILHEQEQYLTNSERVQGAHTPEITNSTMVQRSFGGRAVTVSKCFKCEMQSERADNFRDLQLSFPSHGDDQTVQSLVDYYLQPEKLCEDNQYHCDRCHGLTDGERVTRIMEPPRRLVLTLKHFRYDPASQQRTKLLQRINLDSSITLKTDLNEGGVQYEMYAAVVHYGSNLDSGHYYTFARDGQDWYKFNDCIVSRTSAEELCSIRPPETPYILFYSREDFTDPEPLERSALSSTLENILMRDQAELDSERRRRTQKVTFRRNQNDDPPPPGCGGSFMNSASGNRYVC